MKILILLCLLLHSALASVDQVVAPVASKRGVNLELPKFDGFGRPLPPNVEPLTEDAAALDGGDAEDADDTAEDRAALKEEVIAEEEAKSTTVKIVNGNGATIVITLPFPREEMPNGGVDYPLAGANPYKVADYNDKWRLKNDRLRRWHAGTNFANGGWDAVRHSVKSFYNVFRHPRRTAKRLWYAVRHPISTVKAFGRDIKENTEKEGLANTLGSASFELATLTTPLGVGKGVSKFASKAGTKMTQKAAKGGSAAGALTTGAVAAEQVAHVSEFAGNVADFADKADLVHAYNLQQQYEKKRAGLGYSTATGRGFQRAQ